MDPGWCDVCLSVNDVAVTREFYEKLGFRAVDGKEDEGWRILTNGQLRLGLYKGHIREPMLNFRGRDILALCAELRERGLELEWGPKVESDGSAGAFLRDPDGFAIYLNTAPGETMSQ